VNETLAHIQRYSIGLVEMQQRDGDTVYRGIVRMKFVKAGPVSPLVTKTYRNKNIKGQKSHLVRFQVLAAISMNDIYFTKENC
jgi:hypothetical protein